MCKLLLLLVLLFVQSCSPSFEAPIIDFTMPMDVDDLDDLEVVLRDFGNKNDFYREENNRSEMQILNGGEPAITFWFFSDFRKKHLSIIVTTVIQNQSVRIMLYENGFKNFEAMNYVQIELETIIKGAYTK